MFISRVLSRTGMNEKLNSLLWRGFAKGGRRDNGDGIWESGRCAGGLRGSYSGTTGQRDVQRVALSTEDVYEPVTHKVGGKRVN